MRSKIFTTASVLFLLAIVGRYYAKPVLAQVRAALVQNVDEQGRNPYQEAIFANNCAGTTFCNYSFSAVPAGKRLVLTNISGFVDVKGGTLPNNFVQSSFGGNQYADVFFPSTRGTVTPGATRMVTNEKVLAYFGPGEIPHGFQGLTSTTDTFASGGLMTLTGYYINLP